MACLAKPSRTVKISGSKFTICSAAHPRRRPARGRIEENPGTSNGYAEPAIARLTGRIPTIGFRQPYRQIGLSEFSG